MTTESFDIPSARRYLLAQMSDTEMCAVEEELLGSDSFLEQFLAAEGELIDEYVRGELSPDDQASFLHYLSRLPDRQQALRFAHALKDFTDTSTPVSKPYTFRAFAPTGLLAAATLVFAVVSAWSLVELSSARKEAELARGEAAASGTLRARVGEAGGSESVRLTAGRLRSVEGLSAIELPAEPRIVSFELDMSADDYQSYYVAIYNSDAVELLSLGGLRASASSEQVLLRFSVSSEHFQAGDFFISLMGVAGDGRVEPLARYDVRFSLPRP